MPPFAFCRDAAPTWTDMRPATSLIGVSNGNEPSAAVTVSYAMAVAPEAINALVCSRSAARCR